MKENYTKHIAYIMVAVTLATSVSFHTASVYAEEVNEKPTEYIVIANNSDGVELAENTGDQVDEVSDEVSESLTDNDVTIVEMTEAQAEDLQADDNILLVEENIILEGSEDTTDNFELPSMNLTPEEENELKMAFRFL